MSPSSSSSTSTTQAVLSGTLAGSLSTIAGAPFDYMKVRLQTSQEARIFSLFSEALREKGVLSFFRGTTPALVCSVLENSVVFGANATIKRAWRSISLKDEETLLETAVVGGLSGIFSATAISPFETTKIRLQQGSHAYTSMSNCLKRIVREEGVLALFRGLPAQLPRDILFNFVFFSSFEASCRMLSNIRRVEKDQLSVFDLVASGGLAGAAGWTFTLPFDIVKSRSQGTQAQNQSSLLLAKKITFQIYREAGLRGFFRGWGAAVARAFPVNGVLFACYSLSERAFNEWNSSNNEVTMTL